MEKSDTDSEYQSRALGPPTKKKLRTEIVHKKCVTTDSRQDFKPSETQSIDNESRRGLPLQIIGDIVIEHDNNQMEVNDGNLTIDHVQKPRQMIEVRLNKAPKTSAERGREFRARKALLKQQCKQRQEPDAIVEITTDDIQSAGPSENNQVPEPSEITTIERRAKSAEATRRWREKKKGVSESSKKQAKTAAQRMREYRERKKLTHSKDRSYACVYCGQIFLQKSKFTYHIRKHTGENKKYSDERSMVRHLRAAHSNIPNKCPICRKLLASATSLKHHVLTHSPMNTFSCKCCVKTAGCKRTMLRHLSKRHGMEPTAINIKDYYHRLDPRECKLDLDEETLSAIFGPAKKPGIIGDFITYTDITEVSGSSKNNEGSEASADDTDQNDDKESNDSDGNDNDGNEDDGKEKSDGNDGNENMETNEDCGKLEPTDFVSVKLEPTDFVNVKMEPMDEDYE